MAQDPLDALAEELARSLDALAEEPASLVVAQEIASLVVAEDLHRMSNRRSQEQIRHARAGLQGALEALAGTILLECLLEAQQEDGDEPILDAIIDAVLTDIVESPDEETSSSVVQSDATRFEAIIDALLTAATQASAPEEETTRELPPPELDENEMKSDIMLTMICPICCSVPHDDPIVTSCDHIMCRACFHQLRTYSDGCPLCPLDRKEIASVEDLSGMARRVWGNVAVRCPRDGCDWTGTMISYKEHCSNDCNGR